MGDNLVAYIERLEYLAFFAGYPLVYTIVNFLAGSGRDQSGRFPGIMIRLLPFAYAFTGTLFLGLVLREAATDAADKNIQHSFHISLLKIWGIGAIVFWIPLTAKKPVYSLTHCLVFFFLILKDIFLGMSTVSGRDLVKNDMRIFMVSFLLNALSLAAISIFYFIRVQIK
jgi:hypothetical protein